MITPGNDAAPGGHRGQAKSITKTTGSDDQHTPVDDTTVRCQLCGHILTAPKSVALETGPVCATRFEVHP
ncbi:DUF6011 domain-containing protein [Rhodococcus sp. (in: high G+C Gram-positive bacteria)]|uniref:DUF6011 domain-containing protein n=1 Tax=Rhodococcus sp. TaxID=1831 RepID=UPI00338D41AD